VAPTTASPIMTHSVEALKVKPIDKSACVDDTTLYSTALSALQAVKLCTKVNPESGVGVTPQP
jgi:hypothetical protein